MGKWISGKLECVIEFNNVYVEDGQSDLSAIFPDGWEGEMSTSNLDIDEEEVDKNE